MSLHDRIDDLLNVGIDIIDKEINDISKLNELDKQNADKLIEYMKTLVAIRKDWRIGEKEAIQEISKLSDEELNALLIKEADKVRK